MSGSPGQSKISEAERQKLAEKLDKELDEHFRKLEERAAGGELNRESTITEDNWEEALANHPFFQSEEWKEGKELSPLMKGIQDLKYSPDENSPEELATNYKEDGNFNFKCKKYRFAIASYTEGLKAGGTDVLVNTQLYTNRAAAQFHIGNYRSSLRDCEQALHLTPGHTKALVRGAECCLALRQYGAAVTWCDRGLGLQPDLAQLVGLRQEAVRLEAQRARDDRKRAAAEKKAQAEERRLLELVQLRGIRVEHQRGGTTLSLADLEPCHPAALHKRLHLDPESEELIFPVLLVYPEFGETDFIEEWREGESFSQHLATIFDPSVEAPGWDLQRRYSPASVVLYFEDLETNHLQNIPQDFSLIQAITQKGYLLRAGSPAFFCFVRDSPAHQDYLSKYNRL